MGSQPKLGIRKNATGKWSRSAYSRHITQWILDGLRKYCRLYHKPNTPTREKLPVICYPKCIIDSQPFYAYVSHSF